MYVYIYIYLFIYNAWFYSHVDFIKLLSLPALAATFKCSKFLLVHVALLLTFLVYIDKTSSSSKLHKEELEAAIY